MVRDEQLIQYEPTGEGGAVSKEQQNVNRMLMRRYAAIQKARDADVFGILVGTLGVGECAFFSVLSTDA